jgi:ABC-type phosphate transport system permease subunit
MGIFYVMSYVVQVALSLIQSIFNITSQLTIPNADAVTEDSSLFLIIVTLIFFIITFFVGILLNTILQINQSIVYYGLKEDKEQINTKSDIDLIGANNEQ